MRMGHARDVPQDKHVWSQTWLHLHGRDGGVESPPDVDETPPVQRET